MGGSSRATLEVDPDEEEGSAQSGEWCHCLDQGESLGALAAEAAEFVEQPPVGREVPWRNAEQSRHWSISQ